MSLRFVVLGLDHRHAYGMAEGMIGAGAELAVFWTKGTPQPLDGFVKRFPDAPRAGDLDALLSDGTLDLALIAARPDRRADLAIRAMEAGLDVMVDKPGCIDMGELGRLRDAVARTGRIWSVNFSERFEGRREGYRERRRPDAGNSEWRPRPAQWATHASVPDQHLGGSA